MIKENELQIELKNTFDLPDYKIVFLLFKNARELLNKSKFICKIETFEELKSCYKCIKAYMTEENLNALCKTDEQFKKAEKWLLNKLHQEKQIALYNKLYEQGSGGDVRSIAEFVKFSKAFFDDDSSEDEEALFFKNIEI